MPKAKKDVIAEALKDLAGAVASLEKKMEERFPPVTVEAPKPEVAPVPVSEPEVPFPLEYRMAIDEVLNSRFGASVKYVEGARFELTITVPKEYSNADSRVWDTDKADRRVKIMDNHLGVAGVREYATLVAENLGPEIRSKINEDRVKVA